ncbi:MAG: TolC family protein [Planctomycetota bacterium]
MREAGGEEPPVEIAPLETLPGAEGSETIDLATALRLAGARNVEVEAVRERVEAAQADVDAATALFLPSLSVGVSYFRHDGRIQDTGGDILDVSKSSLAAGPAVRIAIDPAAAYFERLRAKQMLDTARFGEERTRAEAMVHSAVLYLELLRARAQLAVAGDALKRTEAHVKLSREMVGLRAEPQVHLARALAELARDQERLIQATGEFRRASVDLAVWLRLPPATTLTPADDRIAPTVLVDTEAPTADLIQQALSGRPDLKELQALHRAAEARLESTRWSPWAPRLDLFAGYGAFGGGSGSSFRDFGDRGDYGVALTWTFDLGQGARRRRAGAEAREAAVRLRGVEEAIAGEVIRARDEAKGLRARIAAARSRVVAAGEALDLVTARFRAGDAILLEILDAGRELAESREELVGAVIHFNQTQHHLHFLVHGRASGESPQ